MLQIIRRLGISLMVGALLTGCTEQPPRAPTGPSASPLPEQAVNWACGRVAETTPPTALNGWTFQLPVVSCPGQPWLAETAAADGIVTAAPGSLRSAVTGTTVRLEWNAAAGATTYLIEAGSATTLANLARFNTGTAALILVVGNVPRGVYYLRVRGVGPDNLPGPASNEVVVSVGGVCGAAPGAPTGLAAQVVGNQVTLSWAAGAGDAPASYVLEAGSAQGLSNILGEYDTGNATPGLGGTAPNGTYYVRLRGRNACGTGAPSNEVVLQVPGGGCGYTVTPASIDLSDIAGGFQVQVDTRAGCAWTASALTPFITVSGSPSGSGPGAARFNVTANTGSTPRSGTVRVAWSGSGQDVRVSQIARPVVANPGPPVETVLAVVPNPPGRPPVVEQVIPVPTPPPPPQPSATTGPLVEPPTVTPGDTQQAINVRLRANSPFNTVIAAGGSGTAADGALASDVSSTHYVIRLTSLVTSVDLVFNRQTSTPFDAQFAVAIGTALPRNYEQTRVTGPTTACSFTVSPLTFGSATSPIASSAQTLTVNVSASPAGCTPATWTASSGSSFVSVSPTNGTGNGTVTLNLSQNPQGSAARNGTVTVAGRTVSIFQAQGASTCNALNVSGADTPVTRVVELGRSSGTFDFTYQTQSVADRMLVIYQGQTLFDTGCVGTGTPRTRAISYSGSSTQVSVQVQPNCLGGTGTAWQFTVSCPR